VFYQDATWMTLPDDDPYAAIAPTWINGRCRDISKRHVEQVFETVFGYPLAIDPLTHRGVCLRKSNRNYVKNVTLLQCPIPIEELNEDYVYERLIDSRVPGLGAISQSTYVVGGEVATVFKVIIQDWISAGAFVDGSFDLSAVYPTSVFSAQELEQIAVFCDAMGLEYGKLDILRDNDDHRIYIHDANNSPGSDSRHPRVKRFRAEQMAQAFVDRYPLRTSEPASSRAGLPLPGTDGYREEATLLAEQLATQSARLALLEQEVHTFGAGMARLLEADRNARRVSAGKHAKHR
jgi:hypothetical protein